MVDIGRQTVGGFNRRRAIEEGMAGANFVVGSLMSVIPRAIAQQVANKTMGDVRDNVKIYASLTGGAITRTRETRLKRLHIDVAEEGLDAIALAYENRQDRGVHSSAYRNGKGKSPRYAGGKLLNALTSSQMYTVGRDGFNFINEEHLDKHAKQWRRMNFGAGPNGGKTPKAPSALMSMFGGATPVDLALSNTKPSDQYYLPPGFWLDQATGKKHNWSKERRQFKDEFYPTGSHLLVKSAGFAGSRFLDAGVAKIAEALPKAYNELFNEWFSEYKRTGGGPVANETVRFTDKRIGSYIDSETARLKNLARSIRG